MTQRAAVLRVTGDDFQRIVLACPISVLVAFEVDWRGACHILAPVLEDLAVAFKGRVQVCRIDGDADPGIVDAYGIRVFPTLLFFRRGQVVDYLIGVAPRELLWAKLEALLSGENT